MLPCNSCKLKESGCNNCNSTQYQCSRFTPVWQTDNKRYTAISDSCGLRLIPPAYVPNPMIQVMTEIAIEEMSA